MSFPVYCPSCRNEIDRGNKTIISIHGELLVCTNCKTEFSISNFEADMRYSAFCVVDECPNHQTKIGSKFCEEHN